MYFALLLFSSLFLAESLFKQNERVAQRYSNDIEYHIETNQTRLMILKNIIPEVLSNPFGQGIVKGRRIEIDLNMRVAPHNHYFGFVLMGGIISIIPIIFLLKRLFIALKTLIKYVHTINTKMSCCIIFILIYWATLLTIDVGGLFYHVMIAITLYVFYLFSSFKMARPSAMKYN